MFGRRFAYQAANDEGGEWEREAHHGHHGHHEEHSSNGSPHHEAAHDLGVENVLVVPGAVHIPWRTDHEPVPNLVSLMRAQRKGLRFTTEITPGVATD